MIFINQLSISLFAWYLMIDDSHIHIHSRLSIVNVDELILSWWVDGSSSWSSWFNDSMDNIKTIWLNMIHDLWFYDLWLMINDYMIIWLINQDYTKILMIWWWWLIGWVDWQLIGDGDGPVMVMFYDWLIGWLGLALWMVSASRLASASNQTIGNYELELHPIPSPTCTHFGA